MKLNAGIVTKKLAETKIFYTTILDFGVTFENEFYLLLHTPNKEEEISFLLPNHQSQQSLFQKAFEGKGMFLTIEVDDVDKVYNEIKKKGIDIKIDIWNETWGDRHFVIQDPNGIAIDIVKYSPEATVLTTNKDKMVFVMDELAKGNRVPFGEIMADDFCWKMMGTTIWSGVYKGKQAVLKDLMKPLFDNFVDEYTNTAHRFTAEDDFVVVECHGKVNTKSGKPYNNTYCYVCKFSDNKLIELTEYMDTQLVVDVLGTK